MGRYDVKFQVMIQVIKKVLSVNMVSRVLLRTRLYGASKNVDVTLT